MFFMFTPQNVGSCFDSSGSQCAYTVYCAYHGTANSGAIYANQPYAAQSRGCDEGQYPNGDSNQADPTINVTSHEHNEAITDPQLNAWYDAARQRERRQVRLELRRRSQGPNGAEYNQTINGHHYFLQREYSNSGHTCDQTFGGPTKGTLRVTTSPALASQILIDGVPRNSWGLDWLELDPGNYTVSFTHIEGYTEPAPQQVTVTANQTTTLGGTFTQRGSLRVITSPAVPSTISVDGTPMNDWGVWTDVPTGSHQVCFGPTPDFDPPSCQNANVTAGQLTTITGTYTSDPGAPGASGKGTLRVTTSPALASQILIDGVPRNSWGLDWLELDPGNYTVSFTHIEGYTEPAPQQVTVTANQTTTLGGTFTQRGSLRVITSPAVPATISVDGAPMNDWGVWTDVPTGSHQVCFGSSPGFTAPACQNVTVNAGQLTTVTGNYS